VDNFVNESRLPEAPAAWECHWYPVGEKITKILTPSKTETYVYP
jgi:hypothetical protein